jgi:hypothetical protein
MPVPETTRRQKAGRVPRATSAEEHRLGLLMAGRELVSAVYCVSELLKGGKYDQQLSMLRGYANTLRAEIEHTEHVSAGS